MDLVVFGRYSNAWNRLLDKVALYNFRSYTITTGIRSKVLRKYLNLSTAHGKVR